jgi:hypothetical protein
MIYEDSGSRLAMRELKECAGSGMSTHPQPNDVIVLLTNRENRAIHHRRLTPDQKVKHLYISLILKYDLSLVNHKLCVQQYIQRTNHRFSHEDQNQGRHTSKADDDGGSIAEPAECDASLASSFARSSASL